MKTKNLIVTIALLLICGFAQAQSGRTTSSSAASPDAILRQCPALPTVKQLVDGVNTHASGPEIDAFKEKVETLIENAKKILEEADKDVKVLEEKDGENLAQQWTGRTQAELENMSDEEQEAMVNEQLKKFGLGNMTLSQMEALADKSDEEILAAMTKGGATIGGLTPAEIKAMEGMTDAQKEAYMKQGDRAKRAQAYANSPETKKQLKQGENASVIMKTTTELQSINARWREITIQTQKETEEATKQIMAIDAKYAPKVAAIKPTKWVVSGEMGSGYEFSDAEIKAREALFTACRTEQYTLWRNHLIKIQERIKKTMADVPRYDELMKQQMTASGMTNTAQKIPSAGYSFVIEYLDAARDVIGLPEIESRDLENINK